MMSKNRTIWIAISSVLVFVCFFSVVQHHSPAGPSSSPVSSPNVEPEKPRYRAAKKNIWADLGPAEAANLLDFLYDVPNALNLTRAENATSWDNTINLVESLPPNKTDALDYLDGSSGLPLRWARVVINQAAKEVPTIEEYMVGPLPANDDTVIFPLTYCHNSGRSSVRNPLPDYDSIIQWFAGLAKQIPDLVEDLLGPIVNPGNLSYAPALMAFSRPAQFRDHGVSSWASINSPGQRFDAWSLMPQGLYCRFNITGRDSARWRITGWMYNGIIYNSTIAFYNAWKSPGFQKLPLNLDGSWSAAEPDEEGVPGREQRPPVMIQPHGARYRIDEQEKFVSWMSFEFFMSSLQGTAVSLWDLRFRGERIMYELGLQEAMAHYAGADPMTAGQVWLDSLFGMGSNMYELVPGYDCPAYATYLPTSFQKGDTHVRRNNSICVFEYLSDAPLQRHSTGHQVTISKNTYLVVRWVSTVGNYDYTFDYIFYLDGSIEVKVRASGYIFGAYHQRSSPSQQHYPEYDYGYRIHDLIASSMHDHVINFKADLDIAGTENTLYRIATAPETLQYPWESESPPRHTMRLHHTPITTETGLLWPPNGGASYVLVNNASRNTWGEKRGYRIAPGTGMGTPSHLAVLNSTALLNAAAWATHDLWVLRRKDGEPRAASAWNGMEPGAPLVDFGAMVDGEATLQEDLVLFFNLGGHHVPHSGDVPNTLMHTSASAVMFVPHNFFDRDASRAAASGARIDMRGPGRGSGVQRFGGFYGEGVNVAREALEPRLGAYEAPEDELGAFLEVGALAGVEHGGGA